MAVRKAAAKKAPVKRNRKPAAKKSNVIELKASDLVTYLDNLTGTIQRSNELIVSLSKPQPMADCNHAQDVKAMQAIPPVGSFGSTGNTVTATCPALPPLEIIAFTLADKCRALFGFTCHLREQVEDAPPLETEFVNQGDGLKGVLERACRMIDAAHENLIKARNVISVLVLAVVLAGAVGHAQLVKPAERKNIACDSVPVPTTGLTECETMKLSYFTQAMQLATAPINQEANEFIRKLIDANPGKTFEPASQQFPFGRLVAVQPTPAAKPAAPTPVKK